MNANLNLEDYWFTTFTGKKFHIFTPKIEEIEIEDIAQSLSLICRYGGHLPDHYSVAQHSIVVSYIVHPKYALEGLMHDAEEAYTGDMIRPFKKHPANAFFRVVGDNIQCKIEEKFNLFPFETDEQIKAKQLIDEADNKALLTEKRDLFTIAKDQIWLENIHAKNPNIEPHPSMSIEFMHYGFVKSLFLKRFNYLWQKRND